MTAATPVVLTLVDDPELSSGVERIAAAVGARAVGADLPNRLNWLAAAAVVLDEAGARRCTMAGLPRRDSVLLVAGAAPVSATWGAALDVGAQNVCVLPTQDNDLVRLIAEATESRPAGQHPGRVIAVTAGPGGGGASVFAAALALCAPGSLLLDLDPSGGGIELVLGGEGAPGLRWPDLALQSGRLGWAALRDVIPKHCGVSVLSGTRTYHPVEVGAVSAVLDAGRRGGATVVCDLPRGQTPASLRALESADLVVVVTRCDVRGIAATAVAAEVVRTLNPHVGLVVRGPSPGGLAAGEVADATSIPLLATMRPEPMLAARLERGGLRIRRRSPLAGAARAVLDVVARQMGDRVE